MHKRGSWCGRTLAVTPLATFLLCTTTSFASPARPFVEFQVAPLAGAPLATAGQSPSARLRENRSLPAGGWVETGPEDRALVWLLGEPGCQLILEPESRVEVKGGPASGQYVAILERGTLRSTRVDCGATLEVGTPVARLRSQGAHFTLKATGGWISVFHQAGNLQLLFQGQAIPLRALTLTTVSSSGSHRIVSVSEEEREAASTVTSRRAGREPAGPPPVTPAENISPVSASGRP